MLADIRQFFAERAVLEVETPLLCATTGTDPQLDFFTSQFNSPPQNPHLFLQTSPEFAMKRLLAAGSGSIYQICKAFRNAERGRLHNPEFTILEWYRLDFDLPTLMAEVAVLVQQLLRPTYSDLQVKNQSYQELFLEKTGLDPLVFDVPAYQAFALAQGYPEALALCAEQHELWLDFMFSHCVQTAMPGDCLLLISGYPALLSSLARKNTLDARISERFEVFFAGIELGNGFFELQDAAEQEARFNHEIAYRQHYGLTSVQKDQRFLAALAAGLPDCSGIALGLDRLLMLISGSQHIHEVLSFPIDRA
jgi:lysyl-tRNA synthetase class 2